jgi:uncharacterized protein YqgC (DUF456 family)
VDLTDTGTTASVIAGIAIAVGLVGILVPVLPGLVLCWAGVLVWAVLGDGGSARWVVLGLATLFVVAGTVVKYAWPGRRLKRTGVPNSTLVIGGLIGLVGFFVIPVVGLPIGFVFGVWLAERIRLGDGGKAWPSTVAALKAAGLSILVELAAGLAIATVWTVGLLAA